MQTSDVMCVYLYFSVIMHDNLLEYNCYIRLVGG